MVGYRVENAPHAATPLDKCLGGRNMTRRLKGSRTAVAELVKRSSRGPLVCPLCLQQACHRSAYGEKPKPIFESCQRAQCRTWWSWLLWQRFLTKRGISRFWHFSSYVLKTVELWALIDFSNFEIVGLCGVKSMQILNDGFAKVETNKQFFLRTNLYLCAQFLKITFLLSWIPI